MTRYRRRQDQWTVRLTSFVVPLLFLTSGSSLFFAGGVVRAGGQVICSPCTPCDPNGCTSGPCPSGSITISHSIQHNATNATITFMISKSSQIPVGVFNLSWGPTTAYQYNYVTGEGLGNSTPYVAFINYLAPSTAYYYEIQGWLSCKSSGVWHNYHGSYSSSWTTGSDSWNFISGTVVDVNDSTGWPTMPIGIECNLGPESTFHTAELGAEAGSGGPAGTGSNWVPNLYSYNITVPTDNACNSYTVTVYNSFCINSTSIFQYYWSSECGGDTGPLWEGHWNESITVPAPQFVNFGLPTTVTTWIPLAMGFVHNSSGGNVRIALENSATYSSTWSETYGDVYTYSSASWATSGTEGDVLNQNVEMYGQYNVTGMVIANMAGNRTPFEENIQYWGVPSHVKDSPYTAADPYNLSDFSKTTCSPGGTGSTYKISLTKDSYWNATINSSGSEGSEVKAGVYLTFGVGVGVGLDFGLTGIGVGVGVDVEFNLVDTTLAMTSSYHTSWPFSIQFLQSGVYYSVCAVGGGSGNAISIHVYESSS
jgi:hypothetical protein